MEDCYNCEMDSIRGQMMVKLALEKKETKGWGKYRSNEGSSGKILLSLVRRSNHNSSDNPDNEVDFEIQDDREGIFPALSNSIAYRENIGTQFLKAHPHPLF